MMWRARARLHVPARAVLVFATVFGLGRAHLLAWLACSLTGALSAVACRVAPATASDAELRAALTTYADIALASYEDATEAARSLELSIDHLLAEPSQQALQRARGSWLQARAPYTQTEAFRFYDGPIDAVEVLVNTWPIDESYVEAPGPDAPPGILDDVARYPELTRELLTELNARQGETSIATGYHVIEFLLWGRDLRRDGPGDRPYLDYVTQGVAERSAVLAARRGTYLKLAIQLLVAHLTQVTDAWRDHPGSYRHQLLGRAPREALALAWKGLGSLSGAELAGERLTVAYETKNQENEHSCFSDSTHLDLVGNVQGIQNLCRGRYQRTVGSVLSGPGLCELVEHADKSLGRTLSAQVQESLAAVRAIPAPFDTAILGMDDAPSRRAIARGITALQALTDTLARAAAALHLTDPSGDGRRASR